LRVYGPMDHPRFAAIDVGSNAMRLRIVEALGPAQWREVHSARAAVRLGRAVFRTGCLSTAALADACRALREFRDAMGAAGVRARARRLLEEAVDRALAEALPRLVRVDQLVGTGGNVETLAALCPTGHAGAGADVAAMRALLARVSAMTPAARSRAFQLRADR